MNSASVNQWGKLIHTPKRHRDNDSGPEGLVAPKDSMNPEFPCHA